MKLELGKLGIEFEGILIVTNLQNSWPDGYRHAMHQAKHKDWNAKHYPGTLQLCCKCDEPTGRCEEDAIWNSDGKPLCENCYDKAEKLEVVSDIINSIIEEHNQKE